MGSDEPSPCEHPRPGRVLYLDDPYCWYPHRDVREFEGQQCYAVRYDPCPTCTTGVIEPREQER